MRWPRDFLFWHESHELSVDARHHALSDSTGFERISDRGHQAVNFVFRALGSLILKMNAEWNSLGDRVGITVYAELMPDSWSDGETTIKCPRRWRTI